MNEKEHQELFGMMKEREEKRCAWLRHLLIIASGALTVLVSLHADKASTGISLLCMRIAWVSLGSGILLGSICLYGEVWHSSEMVNRMVEALLERDFRGVAVPNSIFVLRPWWHKWSELLCYCSLVISVVALVAFALTR